MNALRLRLPSRAGSRSRHGFTLIELLVVISIIAVLAGLLLPVVSKVMENAKKVETKSAATQIVSAVKAYQTDYGVYPVDTTGQASPVDTTYTASNKTLFNVLRALNTDTVLNTRKVVYFEGNDAKSSTYPKSGFVPSTATGAKGNPKAVGETVVPGDYLDSWGNQYCIRIDTGYSNAVCNPYNGNNEGSVDDGPAGSVTSANSNQFVLSGVIVWTHGSDGALGTSGTTPTVTAIGDDVVSWQ